MYVGDDGGSSWSLLFESGDNYTSFGHPDPWIAYARSRGIRGWRDPSTGRTLYYFDIRNAVNWRTKLKVLAPGH
jgi:hypothetical protein